MLYGLVAQLGERRVRIAEVEGSSPFGSTKKKLMRSNFIIFNYSIVIIGKLEEGQD